jgi:hypothetical protein
MSYRAIFADRAVADIRAMPPALARYTLAQVVNLVAAPTALSRRSHFPLRETTQIFNFDYKIGERYFVVNVLFQFGADEQTLHVTDIPWTDAPEFWE